MLKDALLSFGVMCLLTLVLVLCKYTGSIIPVVLLILLILAYNREIWR